MDFEEWDKEHGVKFKSMPPILEMAWREYARKAWDAAQKAARDECVDICKSIAYKCKTAAWAGGATECEDAIRETIK